jgi:hypothetical protein
MNADVEAMPLILSMKNQELIVGRKSAITMELWPLLSEDSIE